MEANELTIRDREILIATSAMRILLIAIYCVRDEWRPDDIAIAENLYAKLEAQRQKNYERRRTERATNADGC